MINVNPNIDQDGDQANDDVLDDEDLEVSNLEDEDDPDALKAKIKELEKERDKTEKRRRDAQKWAQQNKNEADKMKKKLAEHGLDIGEDGSIVKKQYDPGKSSELDRDKVAELSQKDPIAAIKEVVKHTVQEEIGTLKKEQKQDKLLEIQKSDKAAIESLEGYDDVRSQVEDIIRKDKGLLLTETPFTYALMKTGNPKFLRALEAKGNFGNMSKESEKLVAGVSKGGGKSPSPSGASGMSYEQLRKLTPKQREKLAKEHTKRETGQETIRHRY